VVPRLATPNKISEGDDRGENLIILRQTSVVDRRRPASALLILQALVGRLSPSWGSDVGVQKCSLTTTVKFQNAGTVKRSVCDAHGNILFYIKNVLTVERGS